MKKKHFVSAILLSLSISCIAFAGRPLERGEILQIFEKLTSQPRKTWISAGAIEAKHEEYGTPKASDTAQIDGQIAEQMKESQDNPNKWELTQELQKTNSNVIVRIDGEKYYWEINVNSQTDSAKPGEGLAGNFMADQFDSDLNSRRIFAWDGDKYTMYSVSGNHAIVDTKGFIPHAVKGPLTAGVIPWGHGYCTYENLLAAETSAEEKDISGQTQIHMTINSLDGSEMVIVMDPGKDYAVISSSMNRTDAVTSSQYGNYQMVSGQWVPANILIEKYDAMDNKLLACDIWSFTTISGKTPAPGSFNVEYETDTLIEYYTDITSQPVMYSSSHTVDTDKLLLERLSYAASESTQLQNCATAALKYAVSHLGKDVTDRRLAKLVGRQDKNTSLYAMKEFAERLGLYCRAVTLDIDSLRKLDGCEVILHIPEKNHFIVLGDIDDRYVSSIDFTRNKFFYRTAAAYFDMDWTGGTALLISNQPIKIQGSFSEIADAQLHNIIGAAGYSCTDLIQEYDVSFCDMVGGECGGDYTVWFERWGCESAPSGSCSTSSMISTASRHCFNDPYAPWDCDTTSWKYSTMRACD